MQRSRHIHFFAFAAILTGSIACWLPAPTFAGDPAKKADALRPVPDVQHKVYTNDDLGWPSARSAAASAVQPAPAATVPPAAGQGAGVAGAQAAFPSVPLNPLQDPRWYAQQSAPLEEELADLTSRAEALRRFRATSAGLPTGLVLDAPCEGITTDNLVAQLDLRREQIMRQLDDLDDTARRNGLLPSAVAEARALAQIPPQLTPEEQRAVLADAYWQRSDGLARTRAVIASMRQYAAARGMTLLMPTPGAGGNMTTDLLQRLDAWASSLQSELSAIEDDARRAGAQPSLLR